MASPYTNHYQQKLVNKQYNSPIQLYSDRNVKEVLERETKILSNGAIGIDFNSPLANKPANLQNSAVLRMLEEEESRRRSGQPGSIENNSKPLRDQIVWPPEENVKHHTTFKDIDVTLSGLKRVAWPPPNSELEEYIEQEPVQSQGGPLFSSPKSAPGSQNNQAPQQPQPTSPINQQQQQYQQKHYQQQYQEQQYQQKQYQEHQYQQQLNQQPQPKSPITANNTFQPINSPYSSSGAAQSPYQSAPLSPNVNKSPVSFTSLAKPWSPAQFDKATPHFKPVQPLLSATSQSYQSSKLYQSQEQVRETQTVVLPPYQPAYQPQEITNFQQIQTPPIVETRKAEVLEKQVNLPRIFSESSSEIFVSQSSPKIDLSQPAQFQEPPSSLYQEPPRPKPEPPKPTPSFQPVTPPIQSQPSAAVQQGIAQNQAPPPQRFQQPPKQVEPPPSTITLRPQAPVSQAPPPLVTSQPATATLRGGKHLRGDLKWPPENVREKMAAEEQHLVELSKGPACKPRRQNKDYTPFFEKHALTHAYPGYKIPPGTQFYDHNPVY